MQEVYLLFFKRKVDSCPSVMGEFEYIGIQSLFFKTKEKLYDFIKNNSFEMYTIMTVDASLVMHFDSVIE